MKWDTKLEEIAAPTKYPIGDGDHGSIKPEMYQSHGVPYIRVADIKWDGTIDRSKMVYISEEVNKANPKSFLYPGDIIISKTGATIGKVAIIPDDFPISNTTASIGKVSLDFTKANSRFVFWCMKSRNFQEQMWSVSHKSAQPGFNVQDLKIFKIPLPPLPQQQKIANILDAADAVRQNDKALIAKYDELTQALFLDMFGDPVSNPKGWEVYNFEDCLEIRNGKSQKKVENSEGMYPIYGSGGVMSFADDYISEENTVIIGRKGNINKPILVREKYWHVDTAFGLNPHIEKLHFFYLYFFCIRYNFEQHNKTVTIPSLTKATLLKINLPIPPIELQNQFAERVAVIEEQRAIAQKGLEKSEELFNSLLQKAFKGELN